MPHRPRLVVRLFLSYMVVVVAGATVLVVAVRLLVPRLFDDRMGAGMGNGAGHSGGMPGMGAGAGPATRSAVVSSLNRALVFATLTSLVIAVVVAWLVARRITRPLDRVRATTAALARGEYHERVEPPAEEELAALAHDVNALAATLERTEQRRHELVSELAHELRTPITTVGGFLDGFLDGVIEPTPDVFAQLADEVHRLDRLTSDLGLLSRLDEGTLALRPEAVDLGELVDTVVARLRPQFDASEVTVTSSGPPVSLVADPDRLRQILTNLVGNALRYTAGRDAGRVDISWGRDGSAAWCTVSDNGRGIEPAELDHIFDRFARGSAAAGLPGTGVGLTLARSLARAHGGDITASSPGPGLGARFTVRLPVGDGHVGPTAASSQRASGASTPTRGRSAPPRSRTAP